MIFPSQNFAASLTKKFISVHKSIPGYTSTTDKFSTAPSIS
jgi:hypothetical protein